MKRKKIGCADKQCFLCSGCLPEWTPAIEAAKETFLFNKGETIFAEGDPVLGIYFVYEGSVKIHKHWGKDKELIVRFAKTGDIIGHRGLGEIPLYPISATALENTILCFVKIDFFRTTLQVNPRFTVNLLLFYADELQRSEKKMSMLAHMPVRGRIADALLSLSRLFGTDENGAINISLSRQDLASYAGTTYETVFRTLAEFAELETIRFVNKSIVITQEDQLIAFTQE
ncbi:MAG: Crp/Fnr family transcriptional regulator [Chitinophagaceae bacterium]|nr:MAG: Crp/Fnr family transcriptional regulator [Chitinophagaceae bacterium]